MEGGREGVREGRREIKDGREGETERAMEGDKETERGR